MGVAYGGVQGPPSPGGVAALQAQVWPLVRVGPGTPSQPAVVLSEEVLSLGMG